jgi:hypothetical protein
MKLQRALSPSTTVAIFVITGVAVTAHALHVPLDWLDALTRYQSVFKLLFGIYLLRKVFARAGLEVVLSQWVGRVSRRLLAPLFYGASCALAVPMSVGAVGIVSTAFAGVIRPRHAVAIICMRAVSSTIIILPTTASAAIVSASLPALDVFAIFQVGIPVFILAFASSFFYHLDVISTDKKAISLESRSPHSFLPLTVFWGLLVTLLIAGWHTAEGIALAAIVTFLADTVTNRRPLRVITSDVTDAVTGMSNELLLLFACGLLAGFLEHSPLPTSLKNGMSALTDYPAAAAAVVLLVLPVIAALGVHPVILFSLAFPLIDGAALGDLSHQYLAWSTMFATAQLISPVSVSARLAAAAVDANASEMSFRAHGVYGMGFAVLVWIYLSSVRLV